MTDLPVPTTLPEFTAAFPDEQACVEYLFNVRYAYPVDSGDILGVAFGPCCLPPFQSPRSCQQTKNLPYVRVQPCG